MIVKRGGYPGRLLGQAGEKIVKESPEDLSWGQKSA